MGGDDTLVDCQQVIVSVSSCGSTWFLGEAEEARETLSVAVSVSSCGSTWFLGFAEVLDAVREWAGFSILLRIDLVFGGALTTAMDQNSRLFQYPLADRLGFWGRTPTQRSSPR